MSSLSFCVPVAPGYTVASFLMFAFLQAPGDAFWGRLPLEVRVGVAFLGGWKMSELYGILQGLYRLYQWIPRILSYFF